MIVGHNKLVLLMKILKVLLIQIVSGRRKGCDQRYLENARALGHVEWLEAWYAIIDMFYCPVWVC